MANSLIIDVSIKDNIEQEIQKFERRISELEKIGNNLDFSKAFNSELAKMRSALEETRKETNDIFSNLSKGKLDLSEFDKFKNKMESRFSAISDQFKSINERIAEFGNQLNTLDGAKIGDTIKGWKTEFDNLASGIKNSISALKELLAAAKNNGIDPVTVNTNNVITNLKKRESIIAKQLKRIESGSSSFKLDADTEEDIRSTLDSEIKKYKSAIDAYEEIKKKQKTSKNTGILISEDEVNHAVNNVIDYYGRINNLYEQYSKKTNGKVDPYDIFPELGELFDYVETDLSNELENRLKQTHTKIIEQAKSIGSQVKDSISAQTDTFKLKDGKISVPIVVDENSNKRLLATALEVISSVQENLKDASLTVSVRLVSGYKTKEREEILSQMEEQIANVENADVRGKLENLRDNIANKFLNDISINVHTNIDETEGKVKRALLAIKNEIAKASFNISPTFQISEKEQKQLQEKIQALTKDLTFNLSGESEKLNKSLNRLFETSKIKNWSDYFKEVLAELDTEIDKLNQKALSIDNNTSKQNSNSDSNVEAKTTAPLQKQNNNITKPVIEDKEYLDYLSVLKSKLIEIYELKQQLKTEKNKVGSVASEINSQLDSIFNSYPELVEFEDKFKTLGSAKKFINTDGWDAFVSTLPKTIEYMNRLYTMDDINDVRGKSKEYEDYLNAIKNKILEIYNIYDKINKDDSNSILESGKKIESIFAKFPELKNFSFDDAFSDEKFEKFIFQLPKTTEALKLLNKEYKETKNISSQKTDGTNAELNSLEQKHELLKQIKDDYKFLQTADKKLAEMEGKQLNVGGKNPKTDEIKNANIEKYNAFVEKINAAKQATSEFESKYSELIITLKNGDTVNITDFIKLTDTSLIKKNISDIEFQVRESVEKIDDSIEQADPSIDLPVNLIIKNLDSLKSEISTQIGEIPINIKPQLDQNLLGTDINNKLNFGDLDKEIAKFKELTKAITTLSNAIKAISSNATDKVVVDITNISSAIKDISTLSVNIDFSSLINFLNNKSIKNSENVASRIKELKEAINQLSDIKPFTFNDADSVQKLFDLIKGFPSGKKVDSFNSATESIKQGFNNLAEIDSASLLSSQDSILKVVNDILSKSKELENFATILNKTKTVTKEAKDNIKKQEQQQKEAENRANQISIGKAVSSLRKATEEYGNEYVRNAKNTGVANVSQQAIDNLKNAKTALQDLLSVGSLTEAQIKQINSALDSSDKAIIKFDESSKDVADRFLAQIQDGVGNGKFSKQIESLYTKLDKFSKSSSDTDAKILPLRNLLNEMADPTKTIDDKLDAFKQYRQEYHALVSEVTQNQQRMNTDSVFKKDIENLQNQRVLIEELNNISDHFNTPKSLPIFNQIKLQYSDINEEILKGNNLTEDQIKRLREEINILKSTAKYQLNGSEFLPKLFSGKNSSVDSVKTYVNDWLKSNNKGILKEVSVDTSASKDGIQKLTAQVMKYDGSIQNVIFSWNKASGAISYHTKDAGKQLIGLSGVLDKLKKKAGDVMAYWTANFLNPLQIFGFVKQGIGVIQQYDDALIEMRKVSNETVESLRSFQKASYGVADSVGTTALQLQQSTADFLRLGYAFKDAQEAAKETTILMNVSEFQNINDATSAMISMRQAYEDMGLREITDELNIVGNNFSISTSELAQGMQNAAAALKTQGNSFEEALALITAGNTIIQDVNKVSSGIRTISLRIASSEIAKQQLDELGEDTTDYVVQTTAKLQQKIKDLTKTEFNKEGVNIVDPNGSLKSTYDILLEISKVYKDIQEDDKKNGSNRASALVELLAGKNRSNIAASILLNPDTLEEVYNQASNANGSAQQELDKYLDSITAKLTQFTNQIHEFWNGLISSDVIKFFIDLGNHAMNLVNTFGSIQSTLVAISFILGTKKLNIFNTVIGKDGFRNITVFGKALSDLKDTYNSFKAEGNGSIKSFFKLFQLNSKYIVPDDIFKQYQNIRTKAESLMASNNGLDVSTAVQQASHDLGYSLNITGDVLDRFSDESKTAIVSSDGLAESFKRTSGAGKKFNNFLTLSKSLLGNLATGALSALIGLGITQLVKVIDNAIHDAEITAEKAKSAFEEFNSLNKTISSNRESIGKLSKQFEALSSGVDYAGNNISLTTTEFDEYHEITSKIADMFPSMV